MTERQIKIKAIKKEASIPKSTLLQIASRMEGVSAKEAESLNRIIARLEDWQNRH